jgi:hypothetical protein
MSETKDLDLRTDRREFALAAMLAVLGGVSVTITSGCSGSPATPPPPPPDNHGAISNNHGHVATITSAQFAANGDVVLNLQGTASHNHTLALTADELLQVANGQTLAKTCSMTSHMHTVTFN